MNGKTAVSICNTPMQILNTINLMLNHYIDANFDLIITDEISDGASLFETIKETGIFHNVYFIAVRKFIRKKTITSFIPFHMPLFSRLKIKTMNKDLKFNYDLFLFNNINRFMNIYSFSQKKLEEIIWYEEGLSSYCVQGNYWKEKNKIKKIIWKVLNLDYINRNIKVQYLYHPELADYNVPFERKQLCSLKSQEEKFIELSNKIFNYKKDKLLDNKIIYFEESYRVDGYKINDNEIISNIEKIIGKKELTIKIHPRSRKEFYKDYILNDNTTIPWELHLLNENIDKCVLISISSGCILSPFLYFDDNRKVISLIKLLDKTHLSMEKKVYLDFMEKNIFLKNPEIFLLPNTYQELKVYLSQILYVKDVNKK